MELKTEVTLSEYLKFNFFSLFIFPSLCFTFFFRETKIFPRKAFNVVVYSFVPKTPNPKKKKKKKMKKENS